MDIPEARALTAQPLAGLPRGRGLRRWWGVLPVVVIGLLLGLRATVHTDPLDNLAVVAAEPGDPPGTIAYAGSLAITRGGPVIVGFQSAGASRLSIAGRELRGRGVVKERLIILHGATAIRFAAAPDARLVWSPVGRRGDPEYVSASSLSPEPPERARFDAPGTARLDGAIALAILATLIATVCIVLRRRLAAVSRASWIAMGVIFIGGLAIRLHDLGAAGQTWDEDVNWVAGRNYVTNLLALDFRESSWLWNYEHPPVMKYLAGIGAQLADGFGPARAISAVLVALGCALLVPIGARLYKLRVGVLAAAISTVLPPFVAHGKVVGHEAPTVLWWSLGILLALGVHDYLPADQRVALRVLRWRLVGVGIVIGVAIASRFVNGLLGPLCALIVVVQAPPQWRRATLGWGAALMPAVAVLTVYAIWPRLWDHPIDALRAAFLKLDSLHAPEPFLGATTQRPGVHYFVVYLGATLPLGILAVVVVWAVRAIRARDRHTLIVAAWLVIPLAVSFSPVRQDGVRYVMPCIAALALMAAAGVDFLAGLVEARHATTRHAFFGISIVIAGYLGMTLARTHPYYLDYFGEHTGGAGEVAAQRRFETAWWGEGLEPALAYVNANAEPNARVSRDCIEPSHLAWFREDLWTPMTRGMLDATWIVVYAPERRRCPLPPDARKVFEVVHDGTTLSAVYRR
ncbi:MAG: glycosyltransferase family 39 protein [Myxococcota bacterium]|nr:glycosyltransferase family 39 protein [Myxococcota bacterium]